MPVFQEFRRELLIGEFLKMSVQQEWFLVRQSEILSIG